MPAQGRLHCIQLVLTAIQVLPRQVKVRPNALHLSGPPRKLGQRPHAIADRPSSLTPSTNPRLGVSSQHQELHRYALDGFLGPPSKLAVLTRILHHQLWTINFIISGLLIQIYNTILDTIKPKIAPAITSIGVWPISSFNFSCGTSFPL